MEFYLILFFVCFLGGVQPIKSQKSSFFLLFILLTILGAIRSSTVGADVLYYCSEFKEMTYNKIMSDSYDFEPGFYYMMCVYKDYISTNPMSFIHFIFLIYIICNGWFVVKYSQYPAFTLFLIYGLTFYLFAYNGMRQAMCHGLCLLSIPLLLSNRRTKVFVFAIIVILLSFSFHKSFLLFLFLIPLYNYRKHLLFNGKFLYWYLFLSWLIGYFAAVALSNYLGLISLYISSDRYANYMSETENIGEVSVVSNLMHTIYFFLVVYYCEKKSQKSDLISFFLLIAVMGRILANMLSPISWIFNRLMDNWLYFVIIPITFFWFTTPKSQNRFVFRFITLGYVFFRFYGRLMRDIDPITGEGDVIPYLTIF